MISYINPNELISLHEYKGLSFFNEDEDGLHVWWIAGKVNDAWSVRICFIYNPWFSAWQCSIKYGRNQTLFTNLEVLKGLS